MRRLVVVFVSGLVVSGCSQMDPRLPAQLPAPEIPNAPPVAEPDAAPANTEATPDTAATMLEEPRWGDWARLDAFAEASLGRAREALSRVRAGSADSAALLADFDTVFVELDAARGLSQLLLEVSPLIKVREVAAARDEEMARFVAEVWLDREVYEQLAAADVTGLDPLMQRYAQRVLHDFRLAGVDKDDATRARLAAIQGDIKKLSQDFGMRINQSTRTVAIQAGKLAGMPKDWLDAHPANEAGEIEVSTDYPDYYPVMEYASHEDTRRRMWNAFADRAMPDNANTLREILVLRREAAQLLGKPNWAAYRVQDSMAKRPETVTGFIEELAGAVRPRSDADVARALAAKRQDDPDATAIEVWDRFYYTSVVRKREAAFDSEAVRPYFPYSQVKRGIFDLYGELFGVSFARMPDAAGWDDSVETWQMLRDGEELGRFWLDMHPRPDKFKHAAMFAIQTGLDGARAQAPWAALVCNFPAPTESDPALMQHDEVVTLFHEFGHLIHHLMARGPTIELSADNEGDFIEAPSQLLEEWAFDATILRRFAKHVETGEPIPVELVQRLKKADGFGRGMSLMRQIYLSAFSWFIHVEDPAAIDFEAFTTAMYKRYSPYPRPEIDHLYAIFGHLTDYSSSYYTYQWSLAIAKDLFTRFAPNLMDPAVATSYRQSVLAPGATKDANELVSDFLGRPMNLDAYRAWLTSE